MQARQLDALVRLTTARARADLRTSASAGDAADAIELLKASTFCDLFRDPAIPFVAAGGTSGRRGGGGARAEATRLMAALRQLSATQGRDSASIAEISAICDELGLRTEAAQLVQGLNDFGELLKRGQHTYSWFAS